MKSATIFLALAALVPTIVTATATDIFHACQPPDNSQHKEGDSCSYLSGVASGDSVIDGKCYKGTEVGTGLYCGTKQIW
ncbi:hypothetical protein F4778DRAFT_743656 [Xylariomycetidae sp. FL2044]|nr:hypothetical protein F4778DRAFT_743656 [Xylariomycetidae sp. FL2044]